MFMRPRPEGAPEPPHVGGMTWGVIGTTVALILVIGFAPTQLLRGVSRSTMRTLAAPAVAPPAGSAATPTAALR
jgi:hypothetical protein